MATEWQAPQDWQKDGTIISGVSSLHTGAWTTMLSAKETTAGKETEVVIKTFCVPQDIVQDDERIARERQKFLTSARLQKSLTDAGARAWVEIYRISENPLSFSMKKYGPSLQDLIDRRVPLTARDLYEITLAVLQGFEEIFTRAKRSHGSLKASDVISVPGETPPYRMADPAPKGDEHLANDLYSLGLLLFQLIEHKEWDPLTPIIPTSNWSRFGSKRDRWIQFLNMLLSPTGCHEPIAAVRREVYRLKPASPARNVALVAASLVVLAGASTALAMYLLPLLHKPGPAGETAGKPATPAVDPEIKAAWDKAHTAYQAQLNAWSNRARVDRYDYAKSTELARAAFGLVTDMPLTDAESYKRSTEAYIKAAAKMEEALAQFGADNRAGQEADAKALEILDKSREGFGQAKSAWETAAANFSARHDHAGSNALVQATIVPSATVPPDAAGRLELSRQYALAASRYQQALDLARKEELAGLTVEQAQAAFQGARSRYQEARDKFESQSAGLSFDISAARTLADQARAALPDQLVITDTASYQKSTELFNTATARMEQALATLEKLKRDRNLQDTDPAAALAKAADAYGKKDYGTALSWYRKAADLGDASAMFNVGLLYETGRGTDKNEAEAAGWYQKAVDKKLPVAMVSLGYLYEKGRGVKEDIPRALALYRQAAEANDLSAMRSIGYLYDNGVGVTRDSAEALRWYKKAADLKDPSATFLVGRAYEQGRGVAPDPAQAVEWYLQAAGLKYAAAMNSLGVMYETGHGVKQDVATAIEWYKKAADLNYGPAMSNLGALYDNGVGVTRDPAQAFAWFKKGAEAGNAMSMYNLAVLYEQGRGTPVDMNQALAWYRKAGGQSEDAQARKQALTRLESLGFPL